MLDALKFVQGAVAKKDFVPALTHFRIENGLVLGHNGAIALCAPIKIDLECSPKAKPFVKAIETCEGTIELALMPNGRLSIRSGAFSAMIECTQDPYPPIANEGPIFPVPPGFLDALRILRPFVAEDASRPWAQGVLFKNQSAYATNNIIIIEKWIGQDFQNINVPREAIDELLRISIAPKNVQIGPNAITFYFETDKQWLRAQLLTTEWPDVASILDCESTQQIGPTEDFWRGLDSLLPFIDDLERVFLRDDKLATAETDESGAQIKTTGTWTKSAYNLKQLLLLRKVAKTIDFSRYPMPGIFYGDELRGAICPMMFG